MPKNIVPSLSTHGWVDKPAEKADLLLTHFFYSMKSQTSLYGSSVSSFAWILEQNAREPARVAEETRKALITYLLRFYDSVNITVTERDENPDLSSSRSELIIAATVVEDGVEYQLDKLVTIVDGRFKEFANLNNTETAS